MKRSSLRHLVRAAVMTTALLCADASAGDSVPASISTPAGLLAQADQATNSDQSQLMRILKKLHQEESRLSTAQRWHLKLLDANQFISAGSYAKARPVLQDVIDHSGDTNLSARATALLIQDNWLSHRYEQAYVLADRLMSNLPAITEPTARRITLSQVNSMMISVGQYDLALKYARQMKTEFPSAKGQCLGSFAEVQTLESAGKLTSISPEYQNTVDACVAAKMGLSAIAIQLDQASLMNDEDHPDRAIALLNRLAPDIRKARYQFYVASRYVTLAQAYLIKGDDQPARKFALAALKANGSNKVNWVVGGADKVLYQVEKNAGNTTAALAYYEKYVGQNKTSGDDTKMRALAYQMIKQEVIAKKLKVDALSKQNKILQLKQSLANKAAETSRLYIILLLVVLGFIVLLLYRVKYSQLRFRRMARTDGLTGAFNRQHFLDEARRTLHRLHKADAEACLILLDLDHFKQVNDTHGHAAGDEVLTRAVSIGQHELRASDVCGRLGGEEFGILMPACSCAQGEEIATRIRRALAATPIPVDSGAEVHVSASFGLACSAISGYDLHQLLSVADAALYRAKRGGRNQLAIGNADDAMVTRPIDVVDTAGA